MKKLYATTFSLMSIIILCAIMPGDLQNNNSTLLNDGVAAMIFVFIVALILLMVPHKKFKENK